MINKCHSGWRNAGEASCFLEQHLPSIGTCEAACSVIKMIHKLLKNCLMCSSLISLGDTASALRLGVSSGNIFQTSQADSNTDDLS